MSAFTRDYSRQQLIGILVRCGIWSGFNVLILNFFYFLDHEFIVGETFLSILFTPIGLINCAVLVSGLYKLRNFYWRTLIFALICMINFCYFISVMNELYILSGEML